MKDCNSCGKCCIKYGGGGLSVTQNQIDQWEEERPDIFEFVHHGNIWIEPKTKKQLSSCPFLTETKNQKLASKNTQYSCSIYYDRPDDCRTYPSIVEEMILDDCEMIEAKDTKNKKQAERDLMVIMSDSWNY